MAALDVACGVVGEADRPDEAFVYELRHRAPGLLERNAGLVRPVEKVDVDPVAVEPFEASLASRPDLLGT
jgi:hypothetical protein